jgi:hypothetical protein
MREQEPVNEMLALLLLHTTRLVDSTLGTQSYDGTASINRGIHDPTRHPTMWS